MVQGVIMTEEELRGELRLEQCLLQAEVFRMSVEKGYDSKDFIRGFMMSATAGKLDADISRMQVETPAYILEDVAEGEPRCMHPGVCFPAEEMEWIGYLYRLWHCTTGETSKDIYRQADEETVRAAYHKCRNEDGREVIRKLKKAYTIKQG